MVCPTKFATFLTWLRLVEEFVTVVSTMSDAHSPCGEADRFLDATAWQNWSGSTFQPVFYSLGGGEEKHKLKELPSSKMGQTHRVHQRD